MIVGMVNVRREPIVRLRIRGPKGNWIDLDAIVDTGYSELLVLPVSEVLALALPRLAPGQAVMADGVMRTFDVHLGEIEWDGTWRPILISSFGVEPLIGMRLIADHELRIVATPGGSVTIMPVLP